MGRDVSRDVNKDVSREMQARIWAEGYRQWEGAGECGQAYSKGMRAGGLCRKGM